MQEKEAAIEAKAKTIEAKAAAATMVKETTEKVQMIEEDPRTEIKEREKETARQQVKTRLEPGRESARIGIKMRAVMEKNVIFDHPPDCNEWKKGHRPRSRSCT